MSIELTGFGVRCRRGWLEMKAAQLQLVPTSDRRLNAGGDHGMTSHAPAVRSSRLHSFPSCETREHMVVKEWKLPQRTSVSLEHARLCWSRIICNNRISRPGPFQRPHHTALPRRVGERTPRRSRSKRPLTAALFSADLARSAMSILTINIARCGRSR
jgi:hypothetical protein